MELEKGKNYLVLDQTKEAKDRNIFEIEVLNITEFCYQIRFKSTVSDIFDTFNENTKWFLKTDFKKLWDILEEFPEKSSKKTTFVDSIKNVKIDDLFCKKEDEKS
jgi:hypothetical protein